MPKILAETIVVDAGGERCWRGRAGGQAMGIIKEEKVCRPIA
jgi:hypothetical protein